MNSAAESTKVSPKPNAAKVLTSRYSCKGLLTTSTQSWISRYILIPIVQQDLADIRAYYLKAAGYQVARQMMNEFVEGFGVLGNTPGAGHKRKVGSIIVGFSSGRLETT